MSPCRNYLFFSISKSPCFVGSCLAGPVKPNSDFPKKSCPPEPPFFCCAPFYRLALLALHLLACAYDDDVKDAFSFRSDGCLYLPCDTSTHTGIAHRTWRCSAKKIKHLAIGSYVCVPTAHYSQCLACRYHNVRVASLLYPFIICITTIII
jgi:hypothetical protein